jgi:RNA polymerase sigma-70 factor, ECF subfamily
MSVLAPAPALRPRARVYAAPRMPHAGGATRDKASQALLHGLRQTGAARDAAIGDLHALLIRGAHHELARRADQLAHVSRGERDDLANQAADDALAAILAKLHTFRGDSRFTTWAYKFVLLEAGVKARRRAWHGREVMLEDESWRRLADPAPSAQQTVEGSELLRAIVAAIESELTPHQREVFTALALNGVPIDVLSERLTTTRGALYKTLHDARRKLRSALAEAGYNVQDYAHTGGAG